MCSCPCKRSHLEPIFLHVCIYIYIHIYTYKFTSIHVSYYAILYGNNNPRHNFHPRIYMFIL